MNSSPDNQHFIKEQKEKSVRNFRTIAVCNIFCIFFLLGNTNSSTEMRCSRNQGRSRHEDMLQTDLFDSDENDSDGDLLPFSVG